MSRRFPASFEAPDELQSLALSGCGPLAAWQVQRYFGHDVSAEGVLRACRFDPQVGTFAVGLAVGLAELGLRVEFSTDPDPAPEPMERSLYASLPTVGVAVAPGVSLAELAPRLDGSAVAILLYQQDDEAPWSHFSPILAIHDSVALLPNEGGEVPCSELEARRRHSGVFRQCVLAFDALAT